MEKSRQERYNLIYGNTVRKIEPEPAYREPQRKRKPVSRPKATPRTRQNQQKALEFDMAFIRTLLAALAVIVGVSFFYLSERTKLLNQRTVLAQKKAQLSTLQTENEDLNLEIEQSINLDAIETAAKSYGMKKPDSKQIIHYDSQDVEYVRQYGKIPDAN
ncbi:MULTISPECIES: septum formation initiator family protein [Anaerostipes]|uniref:septum formation initiator family protein n=1 Tax=Anaerostipes TaxID=207244 RepID=UPI000952B2CE|nr:MULTISPECIES: septum formation initiator family protein [Anaerostipes]MCI5624139.1 septum formation initiator family protein [Anaerostipes sp.]MDO4515332.1 septum formation initiator family protein [Lachnospiraceae bacterium]MDY2725448.1 septum formation initiator family protein [Anaerostipes faecalis]OLR60074.1 hypothetical protein BHF70_10930 [Anaerostipes sp. 494a]